VADYGGRLVVVGRPWGDGRWWWWWTGTVTARFRVFWFFFLGWLNEKGKKVTKGGG